MEREGVSMNPSDANERFSRYLEVEARLPPDEARRRSRDLLALLAPLTFLGGVAKSFVQKWWLFLLRGIFAILFGVLMLAQPFAGLAALVIVFGAWAFIDGISAFALALSGQRSWLMVLVGLIGIGLAVLTYMRPDITALGLYAAIAAWSITRGILEIAVAIELRHEIQGEGWLVFGGITSILFGVLMIALPAAGVLALAWLIGIYALVFGVINCVAAFRLRSLKSRAQQEERRVMAPVTPAPSPA
jgi:uncharacterized membrane protein HdeD (DUF308 family)